MHVCGDYCHFTFKGDLEKMKLNERQRQTFLVAGKDCDAILFFTFTCMWERAFNKCAFLAEVNLICVCERKGARERERE